MKSGIKKICQSSKGVSFIQVLLASSAIAGLALVGLKLSEDQRKLAKNTYENYLVEYLFEEMKGLLEEPGVCKATLGGLDPMGDAFSVLRRPVDSSKSNELFALHFPISKEENKVGLFDSQIDVESYEIRQRKDKGANLTYLQVTFYLRESQRKVLREAPLTYTLNSENKITECRLAVATSNIKSDGFWNKNEGVLELENLKLVLGDDPSGNAQVIVSGPMKIVEEEKRVCRDEIEGSLENHRGSLVYCHRKKWLPLGFKEPNWSKMISYKVSRNQKGQEEKITKSHRLCFLSGQEKKTREDGCEVKRLSKDDVRSTYQITAFTSSAATKNICEVSCVD